MKFNPLALFSKQQKGYVGLLLREHDAVIMYLRLDDDTQTLGILDSEKFKLTNGLQHLTDDVDDALYKLEVRTKKTFDDIIFFVYSHAVESRTHELKKPHLAAIKSLVKSMELKPLGFIEAHEAYQKYIFEQKHQSFSALVIESDAPALSVFVYEGGRLVQQSTVERKHSFLADLADMLRALREERELPQHIFLLPSHRPEDGVDLIECAWDPQLFPHEPITKIVQEDELTQCLIQVFAGQISAPSTGVEVPVQGAVEDMIDEESIAYESQLPTEVKRSEETTERMGFTIGGEAIHDATQHSEPVIRPTGPQYLGIVTQWLSHWQRVGVQLLQRLPLPRSRKVMLNITGIAGLLLIVASVVSMELLFHKATVVVTLPAETIKLTQSFSSTQIPVASRTITNSIEVQTAATGVRDIGDPAKGTVTIFNSSLSEQKTFSKGTIITSSNNLAFTLDSDVKVASASGDASSITSGSAKVGVTAMAIGPDSNLTSGSRFTVAEESSSVVIAKNDTALSGGTKRQVQVVSEKDIETAESLVKRKAQEAVQSDSGARSPGATVLGTLTTHDITAKTVSSKVGEGASSLSMKASVESQYYTVKDTDVKKRLLEIFGTKKKAGLRITEKQVTYRITQVKQRDESITLTINATGHAVLPVTETEIAQSLVVQSADAAVEVVKSKFKALSMEYSVEHPLPVLRNTMPIIPQNITIRLQYH